MCWRIRSACCSGSRRRDAAARRAVAAGRRACGALTAVAQATAPVRGALAADRARIARLAQRLAERRALKAFARDVGRAHRQRRRRAGAAVPRPADRVRPRSPARPRLSASHTSASCAMRAGWRKPSQRASNSCTVRVAQFEQAMHVEMFAARDLRPAGDARPALSGVRTTRAAAQTPACSWPMCFGSTSAGVSALPRSWVSAAKPITRVAGRQLRGHVADQFDVHAGVDFRMVFRALRHAVQRVDFRQHHRQRTAVAQRAQEGRRRGRRERARQFLPDAFRHQCGQFAGRRPSRASAAIVSGATVNPSGAKRAMKRAARNTRNGSSTKAGPTWRSTRASMSRAPPNGSTSVPSSSCAIALMVKSRRCRSSSSVTDGSASTTKPR